MAPSGDDQPGRTPPDPGPARGKGKRKPGRQPGAAGTGLPWNDDPGDTVPVFPEGTCECGADLAGAVDLGVKYSHQVTGLPGAKAATIRYDRHAARCGCGKVHVADAPPGAAGEPGTVSCGLQFQAWAVFLMVMHHVPVERCADIIGSMPGTRPCDGWVHSLLARAARAVAAAAKMIRVLILLSRVSCGDETPVRSGPGPKAGKKYLQVACANLLTCYFPGERTLPSFKGFICSELSGTVVVRDRYRNYGSIDGISHQLCCAHLLRDVEDAAQVCPDAHWPAQVADALRGLIHASDTARDQGLGAVPAEMTAGHLALLRRGVTAGLSGIRRIPGGAKVRQPPGLHLLECLRDRENDVLRFLTDTAIPPASNQAERDLRPAKTQQKISGRLRSGKSARDRYAIRGCASTARKHGTGVFTAIRDALAGNPWKRRHQPPVREPPEQPPHRLLVIADPAHSRDILTRTRHPRHDLAHGDIPAWIIPAADGTLDMTAGSFLPCGTASCAGPQQFPCNQRPATRDTSQVLTGYRQNRLILLGSHACVPCRASVR